MAIKPDFEEFNQLFTQFDAVPVSRQILSDALTPVSAFTCIDQGEDGCLFESVIGGEQVGRYSFLATGPYKEIRATRNQITITDESGVRHETSEQPMDRLRELLNSVKVAKVAELPPFTGGAVGFAGYDVIRYVEHLPDAPVDDRQIPDLAFVFYDRVLVFDHITKTLHVVALAWKNKFSSAQEAFGNTLARIDSTIEQLNNRQRTSICSEVIHDAPEINFQSNFTREGFKSAVDRCVEYIKSGDIFQVVISQRLQVPIQVDPFEIYRNLRVLNPSPFMFFLRGGGVTLVGASPEIMCRVVGDEVTVRPLAGTRPRGVDEASDRALEQELLADEKERAEHAMLVDLGRNDVGKVAQFGSVQLVDAFSIERYSHVMHISSTVKGKLREEKDVFDAFNASHPAGTVSGAPKVRAMEIIDELEPHRRGPYAGAVGYIDHSGNMDSCIALRTIVVQGKTAYVQAGAGVVADSNPESEYEETLNKAKALLRAISATEIAWSKNRGQKRKGAFAHSGEKKWHHIEMAARRALRKNDLDFANRLFRESVEEARHPAYHWSELQAALTSAALFHEQVTQNYSLALRHYRESLALLRKNKGDDVEEVAHFAKLVVECGVKANRQSNPGRKVKKPTKKKVAKKPTKKAAKKRPKKRPKKRSKKPSSN